MRRWTEAQLPRRRACAASVHHARTGLLCQTLFRHARATKQSQSLAPKRFAVVRLISEAAQGLGFDSLDLLHQGFAETVDLLREVILCFEHGHPHLFFQLLQPVDLFRVQATGLEPRDLRIDCLDLNKRSRPSHAIVDSLANFSDNLGGRIDNIRDGRMGLALAFLCPAG